MDTKKECHRLNDFFRAFSNRLRLKIICSLHEGEKSVTKITNEVGSSKHSVSQQLKILREIHMLSQRKSGRNIFYSLNNPEIIQILDNLLSTLSSEQYSDWFDTLEQKSGPTQLS